MIDLSRERVPNVGELYGINQLHGLRDLITKNFDKDTYLCEIGCHSGVSTELFAFMCGKVVGIDFKTTEALDKVVSRYDNLKFIQGRSEEVVSQFEDEEFDAVYIDANHDYENVKQDILLWSPKVRKEGFICGHDYMDDTLESKIKLNAHTWRKMGRGGVRCAVDELLGDVRIYSDSSWLAVK